jgi:hypothetical protein
MIFRAVLGSSLLATACHEVLGLDHVKGPVNDLDTQSLDAGTADTSPASSRMCPAGFEVLVASSTSRYLLAPTPATWVNAATSCAALAEPPGSPTHIVVLSSEAERVELASLLNGREAWIGLSDRVDVDIAFRWVTMESTGEGTSGSFGWQLGEPDLAGA